MEKIEILYERIFSKRLMKTPTTASLGRHLLDIILLLLHLRDGHDPPLYDISVLNFIRCKLAYGFFNISLVDSFIFTFYLQDI